MLDYVHIINFYIIIIIIIIIIIFNLNFIRTSFRPMVIVFRYLVYGTSQLY